MTRSILTVSAAAALFVGFGTTSTAQPPIVNGYGMILDEIADVNTAVNWGTHAGDGSGRFFIETQSGLVRLFKNGALVATPFLDIPNEVPDVPIQAGGEKGLLGMAFHPNYNAAVGTPGRGKFYTYTSEAIPGPVVVVPDFNHPELADNGGEHHSVIREWTVNSANPDRIDTTITSRVVMRITQPQSNHNGGGMIFDRNGLLYIALGDGGGGNDNQGGINSPTDGHTNDTGNAQDITNVYGKILRIDPTVSGSANGQYGIPASNPFVGVAGVHEIFAYGLRNPFRISFDRAGATDVLYAGDVGQDAREEVDIVTSGGNFGWVYMEGTRENRAGGPAGMIAPIAEYTHSDGVAIIGGFVYRGSAIPDLVGKYVFGELTGRLFYMNAAGGQISEFKVSTAGDAWQGNLHGLGEDENGELYALHEGGDIVLLTRLAADWGVNNSANWTVATNWIGSVPNSPRVLANFGAIITLPRTVTVNAPQTVGGIRFANANAYTVAGSSTLTIDNDGAATIEVVSGSHTISAPLAVAAGNSLAKIGPGTLTVSGAQSHAVGTVWTVAAGTLNLNSDGGPNLSLVANAATNFGATQHLSSLNVGSGSTATLTAGGAKLLATNTLGVNPTATLNLSDNDLVVLATPPTRAAVLFDVTSKVTAAYHGGLWNLPGITSSAAAGDATHRTTLGVILNDKGAGQPRYTTFDGQTVDVNSVLVKYTYYGDGDLNGVVDGSDYALIDNGFNFGLAGWVNGDFNYDGAIDGTDYAFIDNAFNFQSGTLSAGDSLGGIGEPQAVPEPSTAILLAIGAAAMLIQFARRRALVCRPNR